MSIMFAYIIKDVLKCNKIFAFVTNFKHEKYTVNISKKAKRVHCLHPHYDRMVANQWKQ